jgi:hypothetical protein
MGNFDLFFFNTKFFFFYKIRFFDEEDATWFKKAFRQMVDEDLGRILGSYMQKKNYFVDFLRCFPNKISTKFQSDPITLHSYMVSSCLSQVH